MDLGDLVGRSVTFHYDTVQSTVRLEYGRHYVDEVEAEFFGDHIPEGHPAGIRFEEVSDYRSSDHDHVYVGSLKMVIERSGFCMMKLEDVSGMVVEVSFSFARKAEILSVRKGKDM